MRACGHVDERGQSLIIAVAFLLVVGVVLVALLGFSQTNMKGVKVFRNQRSTRYAADSVMDQAIQWARNRPLVGIDSASADPCYIKLPGNANIPDLVATCTAPSGSGSGLPTGTGAVPKYAVQTLGQRDQEPPSYNGPNCTFETPNKSYDSILGIPYLGTNRIEYGIRFSATRAILCATRTRTVSAWQVSGDVFSNSRIEANGGANIETINGGTVKAVGGCGASVSPCTAVARNTQPDPTLASSTTANGGDPRLNGTQAEKDSWNLPDISGLIHRSVPPVTECETGKTIIFEPGYYDDIAGLNNLFKDQNCKGSTFWFAPARGPGPDATLGTSDDEILGNGYKQGIYYFDFRGGDSSPAGCNYYTNPPAHQWCIGFKYDYNQRVVGGTPQGWNPLGDATNFPPTPSSTLTPTSVDGFPRTDPFWSSTGNAARKNQTSAIDGQSASYSNGFLAGDRRITMANFSPKVASGKFTGPVNVKVAHSEDASKFDRPQISVSYDSRLFSAQQCGTFTLQRGNFPAASPDQLSPDDQARLGVCLNQGDKINTIKIRYTLTGCTFLCNAAAPTLDGVDLITGTSPSQPTFPRPPSGTDSGGDCDKTKPGVEFIFGGDSNIYVSDGNLELCSGPAAQNTAGSQQIALYNVPSLPTMRPHYTTTAGDTANPVAVSATGSANLPNVARIAEPTGPDRGAYASVQYSGGTCGFCTMTVEGGIKMHFDPIAIPAGTSVTAVTLRASYDSNGVVTSPQLQLPSGCSNQRITFSTSGSIDAASAINGSGQMVQQGKNAPACMNSIVTQAGGFDVTWYARATKGCIFNACLPSSFTDQLDGVEFNVQIADNNAGNDGPKAMPAQGCVTNGPNYWNVAQGGEPDCAFLKVDQTKSLISSSQNSRGRVSIKGTIYAPSGALDIDDEDVLYPFFDRGLVARHLMFRGFNYRIKVPVGTAPEPDLSVAPREVNFTVCSRGPGRSSVTTACDAALGDRIYTRSRVKYEIDRTAIAPNTATTDCFRASGAPLVWAQCWARVPKVQWYTADR